FALDIYDPSGRCDLPAQCSLLNCCCNYIRGQRKISRFELEALRICLRFERLYLPSRAAKHIRHIGHRNLRCMKAIDVTAVGKWTGQNSGSLLTRWIEIGFNTGKESALLCIDVFPGYAQCGLPSFQIGVGLERLFNQVVERFRMEQRPPLTGY